MARRFWSCRKCSHRNERTSSRKCQGCGELTKPRPRVAKHAETLRDDSYAVFQRANADIHGVADESCGVCGKPRSQERRHDRDHEHDRASPFFGRPRGLACPGRQGCNVLMRSGLTSAGARELVALLEGPFSATVALLISQGLTLERARLIAAYLERVEKWYAREASDVA